VTELGVSDNDSLIIKFWHQVNRLVWQRAQNIIVLTSTMEERLLARHPYLIDKVATIHNWADPQEIKPLKKSDNWFAQANQIEQKFTVLYSGNLGRCHDAETILTTIKLLKNEPVQFLFVGAGAKYLECRQQIADWGLDNCLFLPYQPKEVLPYSLTAGDLALVSIAPGLEGVVAPSKLYGVMAAGVAIAAVCEPHSYLQNFLQDFDCGACFQNNDAEGLANFIRQLAANPQKAKAMGLMGREHLCSNFTPQIIAQQYAEIIKYGVRIKTYQDTNTTPKQEASRQEVFRQEVTAKTSKNLSTPQK
jgi:glycosyltransferase involved in cell wall biosynthesis